MRIDNITEETKREILKDYENKEITVTQISKKYGIIRSKVAKIAVEMGAQPRCEKKYGKRYVAKSKVCPNCRKTVDVKGARFCCYCGADIRSDVEILVERNKKLLEVITNFPVGNRDELRDVLLENIRVLSGVQK